MVLIIAEKPSLGRSIADALPGTATSKDGCIVKGDYTIVWAYGHLMCLKEPSDYDETYKHWSLDALPIYFKDWQQIPDNTPSPDGRPNKGHRLAQIGNLLKSADSVIHAGDPDEEGQLLIDEILRWFEYKGPVFRLETGDTTIPALQKALKSMSENKQHSNAGWSAYARSVADLLVGVNLTRFFSLNNSPATLTIGRVQTPTLGLVVSRDMQIEGHQKLKYYEIFADLSVFQSTGTPKKVTAKYNPADNDANISDGRIVSAAYAKSKVDMLKDEVFSNVSVTKKTEKENPPLPFNLVKLQTYCSKKFGYTPSDVLEITQALRDNHNAITYNRSDCQYLSDNHFAEAPMTMATVIKNIGYQPKTLDISIKSRCFNDANITAHFAIIPQNKSVDINKLTEAERNVYLAICKFYMAQFMPPAIKERTLLAVPLIDGGTLDATSTVVLDPGYLVIFKEAKAEESSELSDLLHGTYKSEVVDARLEEKETRPPSRYSKASLNEDMTRIAKYVDDPKIKQLLLDKDKDKKGENGSIGTSATRSSIIDNLVTRGFIKEEGKNIISTPLGREFFRILPNELRNPDMTAYWWVMQEDIRSGKAGYEILTKSVLDMIRGIIHTSYPQIDIAVLPSKAGDNKTESIGACPRCGKPVYENKNGFACSGWRDGCKFTIWKESRLPAMKNVKFTSTDAKALLAGKSVPKKKLVKKDGSYFDARVKMQDDGTSPYGPSFTFEYEKGKKRKPA